MVDRRLTAPEIAADGTTRLRMFAAVDHPEAVPMRERLAAAIRYAVTNVLIHPKDALGLYMIQEDGIRAGHQHRADGLLMALDQMGLRIIDDWDPERTP